MDTYTSSRRDARDYPGDDAERYYGDERSYNYRGGNAGALVPRGDYDFDRTRDLEEGVCFAHAMMRSQAHK